MATGENGKIAVLASDVVVNLRRGENAEACKLTCRGLKRSNVLEVIRVAQTPGNDVATGWKTAELVCRLRVVAAEGLTDAQTGEPVAFEAVKHPGISRPIASIEVWDALSDEDTAAIAAAVSDAISGGGGLNGTQRGN